MKIFKKIVTYITSPSSIWLLNFLIANKFYYFSKFTRFLYFLYWPIWRVISVIVWCEIYWKTSVWKWFRIVHFWWIFINPKSVIWKNCLIFNNVTIGSKDFEWNWWSPIIWDNVKIWVWAKLLWEIKIWNNCIIWANSVVTKSFWDNKTIWWIPAKIIK